MNRATIGLIIVFVVILGYLGYWGYESRKGNEYRRWSVDYVYDGKKKAYDRDFLIDYLKEIHQDSFIELDERFSKQENLREERGLYFFFNRRFAVDEKEMKAVHDFVKQGNTAFITAEGFDQALYKYARGLRSSSNSNEFFSWSVDTANRLTDTLITPTGERIETEVITYGYDNPINQSFEILNDGDIDEYDAISQTFIQDETVIIEPEDPYQQEDYLDEEEVEEEVVLNDFSDESFKYAIDTVVYSSQYGPIMIRLNIGKGELYLCSTPIYFTNYLFDHEKIFDAVSQLASDVDYDVVYWDELKFQFLNNMEDGINYEDQGYFDTLIQNRSLKFALYLLLIGLLVFAITGIKRKLNPMAIFEPLGNSSIDFTKTIARLYWLNPDHRKIANLKVQMFLFEARTRYGLSTHELDDRFKALLVAKTGVEEKWIKRLLESYRVVQTVETVHEDRLKQIDEIISHIRANWK